MPKKCIPSRRGFRGQAPSDDNQLRIRCADRVLNRCRPLLCRAENICWRADCTACARRTGRKRQVTSYATARVLLVLSRLLARIYRSNDNGVYAEYGVHGSVWECWCGYVGGGVGVGIGVVWGDLLQRLLGRKTVPRHLWWHGMRILVWRNRQYESVYVFLYAYAHIKRYAHVCMYIYIYL